MGAFGGDVAAVVERLGLQRIILIGHSMGGDVIVEAARRLPGRVAALVWVDAYKRLGTFRTPEQVQAMVAPFRAEPCRSFGCRSSPSIPTTHQPTPHPCGATAWRSFSCRASATSC